MRDIRIDCGLQQHPKIVKLRSRHGADGVLALQQLWSYTAKYCCKGLLTGMDVDSILIAAQWPRNRTWFDDLIDLRLIDETPDGYQIHDWKDHNGFAYYAEERTQQARDAVNTRWNKKRKGKQQGNTDSITERNAPSPSPSPSPPYVSTLERGRTGRDVK